MKISDEDNIKQETQTIKSALIENGYSTNIIKLCLK